jgi:alkaline phosphatase
MTEIAFDLGKAAGVMSTEGFNGATPSSFYAHVNNRNDKDGIRLDRNNAIEEYGTIIQCGFDYYNKTEITHELEFYITNTLNKLSKDDDGFFLMYEEAYIDKHSHSNSRTNAFKALLRFNQAIGRFMEFAFYNPETFILITADHETGGLTPDENGVLRYTTGNHTSANVPIFAYGQGAELSNGVEIENIQIAQTIAALMGEDNHGDQSVHKSLTKQ